MKYINIIKLILLFSVPLTISFSIIKNDSDKTTDLSFGTVIDHEGNEYSTIKIGDQEWMTENLNVTTYRNGEPVLYIQNKNEWGEANVGACCVIDNKPKNADNYGMFYNWYAVNDERKLAPEGWHIPSEAEWNKLVEFLGGSEKAGGKLKNTEFWDMPNVEATNLTGFSAIPAGIRYASGKYYNKGTGGYWWCSDENNQDEGIAFHLYYFFGTVYKYNQDKHLGISVRCVKD